MAVGRPRRMQTSLPMACPACTARPALRSRMPEAPSPWRLNESGSGPLPRRNDFGGVLLLPAPPSEGAIQAAPQQQR